MPLCWGRLPLVHALPAGARLRRGRSLVAFRESDSNCLEIALVNNMPDAALAATERQFCSRLDAASDGLAVRLRFYALSEVPRTGGGRQHLNTYYSDVTELWDSRLDGLIVTGAEPLSSNLKDEPYWPGLSALFDWAERHTNSAVCSCLAAHAAVQYLDGIIRSPLSSKCFGVFECTTVSDHAISAAVPAQLHIPHSRWNEIPENALPMCGYRILTRSDHAGADLFVKQKKSLFVFFQGHPEYEARTLLLEYRRDVGRFLRAETESYPSMPRGYFDATVQAALAAFRQRALDDRSPALLLEFPTALAADTARETWSSEAVAIYRNWLLYLSEQKCRRLRKQHRMQLLPFDSPQETHSHPNAPADGGLAGKALPHSAR